MSSRCSWENSTSSWKMETINTWSQELECCKGIQNSLSLTPVQFTIPRTINFSAQESANVNAQISSKFLEKGIIVKSSHEEGEFISNMFLRPKKDGSFRVILNLKRILIHLFVFIIFKTDSMHTCSQLTHETLLFHSVHWPTGCLLFSAYCQKAPKIS